MLSFVLLLHAQYEDNMNKDKKPQSDLVLKALVEKNNSLA